METWCLIGLWWVIISAAISLFFMVVKWLDKIGNLDEFTDEDRQGW